MSADRAWVSAALLVACSVIFAGCGASAGGSRPTPQASRTAAVSATSPAATVTPTGAATEAPSATVPASPTVVVTPAPTSRSCAPPYPTGVVTVDTVFCADPARMQAARVLRVVDGDTIHVELDGQDETIRFYGIDTTEVGQPCYQEGKERTRELVGSEVRLLPDARNRDRYGRLLRYVYTPKGLSVDAEMVDEGLAHAWRSDGALRFAIIGLEDAAHAAHQGCLWH